MKPRIVVSETIYHHPGHESPTSIHKAWARQLVSDESPCGHTVLLGEAWQPLDLGWLSEAGVGMIYLSNDGGTASPTVTEVSLGIGAPQPAVLVPSGESARFMAAEPGLIQLRCRLGTTRCTITLFPA